jgi:hypothetical protein
MRNKPAGAADAAIILATAPAIYDFSINVRTDGALTGCPQTVRE